MNIGEFINSVKEFIILRYNKFICFVKNMFTEKPKINNQTIDNNNDIHIVKVKVKKVKVKKHEN